MKILAFVFVVLLCCGIEAAAQNANSPAPPASKKISVTGHYELRSKATPNSMEVQQLSGGKIKLHILALWVSHYNKENVHNGEIQAIVNLDGDTAVFKDDHCSITIKFTRTSALVKQADEVGDCDFGANVTASGTYRKIDARRPKFDF